MTPKIIFKYSWIYDQNWKEWVKLYIKKGEKYPYPDSREVQNYIKKAERLWRKSEKKVLEEMSKAIGLKWKEKTIACYVAGNCVPFSDPLTLRSCEEPDRFIDNLIHELIHRLFVQEGNLKQSAESWEYFENKYKNESFNARIHILVHALLEHIFLKYFEQKNLDREIEKTNEYPDYKKAWNIVKSEGYENIIKEFKERIRRRS